MENLCTIYAIERKWKSGLISYDDLNIIDTEKRKKRCRKQAKAVICVFHVLGVNIFTRGANVNVLTHAINLKAAQSVYRQIKIYTFTNVFYTVNVYLAT